MELHLIGQARKTAEHQLKQLAEELDMVKTENARAVQSLHAQLAAEREVCFEFILQPVVVDDLCVYLRRMCASCMSRLTSY